MSTTTPNPARVLDRVACPHCWEGSPPERLLWIAEHSELLGDPRLGPDVAQRFLPTRFNVAGDALDARGFPCQGLACPKCHLPIPRPLLEQEPLFFSILGSPASGKSFFLAAMTWQLRQSMASLFATSFTDADPTFNQQLTDYEESLFLNPRAAEYCTLASLIRKTEEQGDLYDTVSYGAQTVSYPRPFLFSLIPQAGHPRATDAARLGRTVCVYDNAGESFQPGKDAAANPVTRHMAHSRALFVVFDPTQDARFRHHLDESDQRLSTDGQKLSRQESILHEAAARIRKHTQLHQSQKHNRPLIVILTKYDAWSHLLQPWLGELDRSEPWKPVNVAGPGGRVLHALDMLRVKRQAEFAERLMRKLCPDVAAAAESFASEVTYLPVSSVGWCTRTDRQNGQLTMRPSEAQPYWVTVPFLYALTRCLPGVIPVLKPTGVAP